MSEIMITAAPDFHSQARESFHPYAFTSRKPANVVEQPSHSVSIVNYLRSGNDASDLETAADPPRDGHHDPLDPASYSTLHQYVTAFKVPWHDASWEVVRRMGVPGFGEGDAPMALTKENGRRDTQSEATWVVKIYGTLAGQRGDDLNPIMGEFS